MSQHLDLSKPQYLLHHTCVDELSASTGQRRFNASTIPPQQLTTLTSTPQSLNIWPHQVFIPQHLVCSML
jgi:hypothetical protein